LFIKKRQWTLIDEFKVRNEEGEDIFKIKGRFFHIGDDLRIIDIAADEVVAEIKQRVISLTDHYNIYVGDEHVATIHKKLFHLRGDRFKITLENGAAYDLDGSLWNWNFEVKDEEGDVVVEVGRSSTPFESYGIDIDRDADVPFALALVITLEMIREHMHSGDDEGDEGEEDN
jgi:uncharacterized protein YxjI